MKRGRAVVFVGGTVVVVAVIAALLGVSRLWSTEPHVPASIVRIPSLNADVLFLQASEIVRRGPPRVVALRLEGPAELVPHHYAKDGLAAPQPIEAWARQLGAPVVFNAGQFDEKLEHLGWLKANGVFLSTQKRDAWMGLLLSGPIDGGVWGRVADLESADATILERYRHALQSMMLVDHKESVRVRDTDKSACRTVVAEDKLGRILVIVTEGATTLADLARWLPRSGLDIVRAMNLDGGIESQLYVESEELRFLHYGQYGTGTTVFETAGQVRYPLPAVVAVVPIGR